MFPPAVPTLQASDVPAGALILDVREQDEWDAGHIGGAVHIPLADVPARLDEVPDDDRLIVVCRSGGRSARAVAWLGENGYDAANLEGGMGAWVDAGRPIVSSDGATPFVR
jgi:rhodanese-related sulfurtransferase